MKESRILRRAFLERASLAGAMGMALTQWGNAEIGNAAASDVIANVDNRVIRTALKELELVMAASPFGGRTVIGIAGETPEAKPLFDAGVTAIEKTPKDRDAFFVCVYSDVLYLLGNTPRGLLHAVFALQESIANGEKLVSGFRREGVFHFQQRIFHSRFQGGAGERADIRYIAHLGATHCLVCHDWDGSRRSLQGYVTSPIFPKAVDEGTVANNHKTLRRLLDDCSDYGLGAMLWLTELPCQGGPWVSPEDRARFLERFPGDVLSDSGTYEGQVLCFGHPRVQAFYRDLLERFFSAFPEIETIFLFGLDSGGEFCDPKKCPRCAGLSRFEQRDRLIRFLVEEGGRVRPGLRVLTTGWEWDRESEEFCRRQAALPPASGVYLAAEKDGWQCERQSHDFLRAVRKICRDRGQLFIGYDDFHWGDDSVHNQGDIQDFPLGIGAKIRRWHGLEADGVFDHWGVWSEDVWCNSIACRDFFLDPNADADAVCRNIAVRQYGDVSGRSAFAAWQALERAHRSLSDACSWSPQQWPGWYGSRETPPLPGSFNTDGLQGSKLPPRIADDGTVYNPADIIAALQAVADAWRQAYPHYEESARLLRQAEADADDSPLFYRFWWNGAKKSPSRREHLRRQRWYVESMMFAGREIGLQFGLHALWERLDRNAEVYREKAVEPLREDADACRKAADFFRTLGKPKDWPAQYEAKARGIEEYLDKNR